MKTPRRLVVRGVNWLGDAVMSLPALERLREALPETHIALLTLEKLADLWRGLPFVDEVIAFSKEQGIGHVSRTLRRGNFDTALLFPNSFRTALEAWMAGIPARIGYRDCGRGMLLTYAVPARPEHVQMRKRSTREIKELIARHPRPSRETFPPASHHLHQYLRLAATLGANEAPLAPRLPIGTQEMKNVEQAHQIPAAFPRIGLNPGAEYGPAKRWPAERFIEAASMILQKTKAAFLLFGGTNDVRTAAQLEAGIRERGAPVTNLAGKTTLRELAAALALCDVVLSNDTGPMHLASAVGARLVVPFGSTSPELTGPGLPGSIGDTLLLGDVPCAPCFLRACPIDLRCMHVILAEGVAKAVLSALSHIEQSNPGRTGALACPSERLAR